MTKLTQIRFISEQITVSFNKAPKHQKSPPCPDGFTWKGADYKIIESLSEQVDFGRKGKMTKNMRPHNSIRATQKGSWGVGKYTFRVRVEGGRIFELYYDRAPKDVDDRKGNWTLFSELSDS
jgi:hypothetical protein